MKTKYSFLKYPIFLYAGVAAAGLTLFGCGGNSGKEDADCGGCPKGEQCNTATNTCEKEAVDECTTNDECGDKICRDHVCVGCSFDNDCEGKLVCKGEKCVQECTVNADCSGALLCREGQCLPECTENSDCSGVLICIDGECLPECKENVDCRGSFICKDEQCQPGCKRNSDCNTDAGEICHEGECFEGCFEDEDCASELCENGVCVECISESDCEDSTSGEFCVLNHCVECRDNDDCAGNMICTPGNVCVALCQSDEDCGDSGQSHCLNPDQPEAAECVQCIGDDQCDEYQSCNEHVCKYECTKDIDCTDNKKCDPQDYHCYQCISSRDCGNNLVCDRHECRECAKNDADCDAVVDEEDVCPYNPNIKIRKSENIEVECNYVTEGNSQVFEIWHALDLIRLQEEIRKAVPEASGEVTCKTPSDAAHPGLGECCNVENYTASCKSNQALSCRDGVVIQTECPYGCEGKVCSKCTDHIPGQPYTAGNCCFDDFVANCTGSISQRCENEAVVEETCAYGCGVDACNHCNVPADESKLVAGDCCDAETFAQVCSNDSTSSLQCIDGVVQVVSCENSCSVLNEKKVLCVSLPQTLIKARLMQDINLADAMNDEDIQEVPFEALRVVWTETVTNSDSGEVTTVVHKPDNSDYRPYSITDDTCVGRWPKNLQINLSRIEFDGQEHRISFKVGERNCSAVDTLFGDIEDSYIHDLTLNYNVRGLISSVFAKNIRSSTINHVSVIGNINLETRPALNEVDVDSYISNNRLKSYDPYYFGIITMGSDTRDNLISEIHYKGNITSNFTLSNNDAGKISGLKVIPGMSGLIGYLDNSLVQEASLTVPDFVYTYGRAFVPVVWESKKGATVYNIKIDIPQILGLSENTSVAASFVSGFGVYLNELTLGGNVDISLGNMTIPGGDFYGMGYHLENAVVLDAIQIRAKGVYVTRNHYGLADYCKNSQLSGLDMQFGSLVVDNNYFGLGYDFTNNRVTRDISIKTGGIEAWNGYLGLSDTFAAYVGGNIGVEIDGDLETYYDYYGLAKMLQANVVGDTSIRLKGKTNLHGTSYYGLAKSSSGTQFHNVSIRTGDIATPKLYVGLMIELSELSAVMSGQTDIETGNITDVGVFYGLTREIKGSCKDITLKYGDITQIYQFVMTYTNYFWGLASSMFSESEGLVSNIKLTMGNVDLPFYYVGLVQSTHSNGKTNKLVMDNVELTVGDVTLGNDISTYKGDFDGLFRDFDSHVRNLKATYGNVYIKGGYRGWALSTTIYDKGKYENVIVEIESIVSDSGRLGMVDSLDGTLENVAVAIRHLQTDSAEASAVTSTSGNAKIKNLVYYADVYAKKSIASGFINNIRDARLSLENIFSAVRFNTYTKTNETTHKATDGNVYHGQYLLFNAMPSNSAVVIDDTDPSAIRYRLDLGKTKNVFWLKRHSDDKATEKPFYTSVDNDADPQFMPVDPNATEYALQSGENGTDPATGGIDPDKTLSGCEWVSSCDTQWATRLKKINEPRGSAIYIPWMK